MDEPCAALAAEGAPRAVLPLLAVFALPDFWGLGFTREASFTGAGVADTRRSALGVLLFRGVVSGLLLGGSSEGGAPPDACVSSAPPLPVVLSTRSQRASPPFSAVDQPRAALARTLPSARVAN
eukprot:496977-Prymnesium_polylepis.1